MFNPSGAVNNLCLKIVEASLYQLLLGEFLRANKGEPSPLGNELGEAFCLPFLRLDEFQNSHLSLSVA